MEARDLQFLLRFYWSFDAEFGEAEDGFEDQRNKFANALSDIIIDVLITKFDITGQTNVISGSSAGSYPTIITKA